MSSIEPATNLNINISHAHAQGNAAMHNNDHNNDKKRASANIKNEVVVNDVDEIP